MSLFVPLLEFNELRRVELLNDSRDASLSSGRSDGVLHILFDCVADLKCPVRPYPRTEISCHIVIEPYVEFDSLARLQAPNLVFDLFEGHDDFSTRSTSDADPAPSLL